MGHELKYRDIGLVVLETKGQARLSVLSAYPAMWKVIKRRRKGENLGGLLIVTHRCEIRKICRYLLLKLNQALFTIDIRDQPGLSRIGSPVLAGRGQWSL